MFVDVKIVLSRPIDLFGIDTIVDRADYLGGAFTFFT